MKNSMTSHKTKDLNKSLVHFEKSSKTKIDYKYPTSLIRMYSLLNGMTINENLCEK